jgi:hypothetical protein
LQQQKGAKTIVALQQSKKRKGAKKNVAACGNKK